jgi:hypothetical protein
MPRVGTELTGFTVETGGEAVRVEAWGFWGAEVAEVFASNVVEACRVARAPVRLIVDVRELKPQREEGQAAFRDMMVGAARLGVSHAVMVVTNAITKLQLARLASEKGAGSWSFVASPDSAVAAVAPLMKARS